MITFAVGALGRVLKTLKGDWKDWDDQNIVRIGLNTVKSPRDLRRLLSIRLH